MSITYPIQFASWFTSCILNTVKHPTFGIHQVTPGQIRTSPVSYQNKLYKAIAKAMEGADRDTLLKKIEELK